MKHSFARVIKILLLLCFIQPINAAMSAENTLPNKYAGEPCVELGTSMLSADKTSVIGCFKKYGTQTNCGTETSPTCIFKLMAVPGNLVKVSFELVGGGGGGGGNECCTVLGGAGGPANVLRFSTYLPKGEQISISTGSGGLSGSMGLGVSGADGGSGLMAFGGRGGGTGGGGDTRPGPSGIGGGGGAASIVFGKGLFAVAGGGGGGGGASLYVAGGVASSEKGGAQSLNGLSGAWGCNGRDGGGGGGGGGGYPGGSGGDWGCDSSSGGKGGKMGISYYNSTYGSSTNPYPTNSSGRGTGGAAQSDGICGRITIWSSTGAKHQFDCHGAPFWTVE